MPNNYKPSEAARLLGISVRTLQRWDIDGVMIANRTPTNRRFYTQEQIDKYFEKTRERVSNKNSKFQDIVNQLCNAYSPTKIILFGSQSKGTASIKSDIDVCVVMNGENKRQVLADMYYRIESEKSIDFVLYTPSEWESCIVDVGSFAHKINREGIVLYG